MKKVPEGFQLIRVHTVFDVKHDGRHQAQVAGHGCLTDGPLESIIYHVFLSSFVMWCMYLHFSCRVEQDDTVSYGDK